MQSSVYCGQLDCARNLLAYCHARSPRAQARERWTLFATDILHDLAIPSEI
jgi:hypothetical protein